MISRSLGKYFWLIFCPFGCVSIAGSVYSPLPRIDLVPVNLSVNELWIISLISLLWANLILSSIGSVKLSDFGKSMTLYTRLNCEFCVLTKTFRSVL